MNEQKQICTKCNVEKSITQFSFRKDTNNFRCQCKPCVVEHRKKYYADNKESIATKNADYRQRNKEKIAAKNVDYYKENKEKIAAKNADYYKENKEKIAARVADYYKDNKEKLNTQNTVYRRNRYKNDENFRLLQKTRSRIYEALNGRGKSFRTRYILGISLDLYKKWIRFQMTPEMDFSNIHIDHVKPISSFDISNEDELLECFNWINTQPLLKKDNLKKNNNFNPEEYENQFRKALEFKILNTYGLL